MCILELVCIEMGKKMESNELDYKKQKQKNYLEKLLCVNWPTL